MKLEYTVNEAAMRKLTEAAIKLTGAFSALTQTLNETAWAADALLKTPAWRRFKREQELGYSLPDWVWRVEEQQRRQFGSGNGRVMRD